MWSKLHGGAMVGTDYKKYALMMKALGDESRIKIFDMLSQGELCACKVLEAFDMTQPTLSYHMKILCDSGLVNGRRDGIWMKYTINSQTYLGLKDFIDQVKFMENADCSKQEEK